MFCTATTGSGNNLLQRYRLGIIGLLAVVTSLQMWSANVTLNLTDTLIRKAEDNSEVMRARVTFFGFAALSALNAVLIFILGKFVVPVQVIITFVSFCVFWGLCILQPAWLHNYISTRVN